MNRFEPKFSGADIKIFERETSFDGFLKVDKFRLKYRLYDGHWSEHICRELSVRNAAVGVLLFDPIRDEIVLVRQFRIGALKDNISPWLLELVAGMVDKDETLENVAIRETKEESNCEIIELYRICDYFSSPGVSDEKVTLFCGKIDSTNARGIYGLADENEDIEVVTLHYSDVLAAVESGYINNAMSIIAIQWLALNKDKIVDAW